jgi:hypothetical protein
MMTFVIAFAVFALALLGLGLGLLMNRGPVQGSCGGLAQMPGMASDCAGLCRRGGGERKCPRRTDVGAESENSA